MVMTFPYLAELHETSRTIWNICAWLHEFPFTQNHVLLTFSPLCLFGAVSQRYMRCCLLGFSPYFAPNKTTGTHTHKKPKPKTRQYTRNCKEYIIDLKPKRYSRTEKSTAEINNSVDGLLNALDTAEEIINEVGNRARETIQNGSVKGTEMGVWT